jgi:uncharacterized protein (TIGR02598 family)
MRKSFNNTFVRGCPLTGRRSGFSLVEIMIALGVIAIGLIAIVGLIPQGVQSARDAADNTLAATIVQDTFNQIRAQALIAWPPSILSSYYYDAAGTNEFNSVGPLTFYRVQLTTAQPSPNLLTVSAMVMWPVNLSSTVNPLNTNFFFTSIANYQH